MSALAPGTILQLMYLKERLVDVAPGRFIEVGPGTGEISNLLLKFGWGGVAYELESRTVERLKMRFSSSILDGRYEVKAEDYMTVHVDTSFGQCDLIISSMVMEHLDKELESTFMHRSTELLRPGGLLIGLVPASPTHWGIEDEIAGHCRRYTREDLQALAIDTHWEIRHLAGLTYPVSNILLPVSNFLVGRAEKSKMTLTDLEKTKASGIRSVRFKTRFPNAMSLVLNRYVLFPLHLTQKAFSSESNSLVLYFEATPQQVRN